MNLTRSALTKPWFLTTPIFYVNAKPHIGHLYTALLADAQSRFQRLRGRATFLLTGTDEHGLKVQRAASASGLAPSDFCASVSKSYQDLFKDCAIEASDFIRTSEPRHVDSVRQIWTTLRSRGHIRKATYEGWYCVPDECFVSEKQTQVNENQVRVSLESGHPVEWSSEDNYVFELPKFIGRIKTWLETHDVIHPRIFANSLSATLQEPFDLSVSRPKSRIEWGIPVPDDEDHVIYVWLDALTNYYSAASSRAWPVDCHVVGKDILKFHAIYWPAFLMAADLELPKKIFVHSHWMVDNEKMSKSKNNVIDPVQLIDRFSAEGLRYFLLREGVPRSDGNYSEKKLIAYLNAELSNTLGNLLSRCTSQAINVHQTKPEINKQMTKAMNSTLCDELTSKLETLSHRVEQHYEDFEFYYGVDLILECIRDTNSLVQEEKPWELKKTDPDRLNLVLALSLESLRITSILLQPIVPILSKRILDKLNVTTRSWSDATFGSKSSRLSADKVVLFKRVA